VQRNALPRERHGDLRELRNVRVMFCHNKDMHRRVQQRRVNPEAAYAAGRVRQLHLGENLVTANPACGQSLERRPVAVPAGGEPFVAVRGVHRDGARRRPHR